MKAAFYEGDRHFAVRDARPEPPGSGEVRIDVSYCGICGTDIHIYHGVMDHRVRIPQVIGHEMSGRIAEIGKGVKGFGVGDTVAVRPLDDRGATPADKEVNHICAALKFLGIDTPGAFQGSWTVPAFTLHKLPEDVDMKLAAFVEPLAVACHDVRLGQVEPGDTAVVIEILNPIPSDTNGPRKGMRPSISMDSTAPGARRSRVSSYTKSRV